MAKHRLDSITLALLSLALLSNVALANADKNTTVLRMCYEEQELQPYYMGNGAQPPAQNPGIMIEIMQNVQQQLPEIQLNFVRVPWQRCLNQIAQNISDVVVAGYQEERTKIGKYPIAKGAPDTNLAIAATEYCLFTHRNSALSWNGKTFSTIPDKPVAVPQGYSALAFLERKQMPVVTTNSSLAAMELLAKSVTEGAVTHCESGGHFLFENAHRALNITAHSPPLEDQYGYLLFSHRFWQSHPELVQKIWQTAANIRTRQFSKLLQKYETLKH